MISTLLPSNPLLGLSRGLVFFWAEATSSPGLLLGALIWGPPCPGHAAALHMWSVSSFKGSQNATGRSRWLPRQVGPGYRFTADVNAELLDTAALQVSRGPPHALGSGWKPLAAQVDGSVY